MRANRISRVPGATRPGALTLTLRRRLVIAVTQQLRSRRPRGQSGSRTPARRPAKPPQGRAIASTVAVSRFVVRTRRVRAPERQHRRGPRPAAARRAAAPRSSSSTAPGATGAHSPPAAPAAAAASASATASAASARPRSASRFGGGRRSPARLRASREDRRPAADRRVLVLRRRQHRLRLSRHLRRRQQDAARAGPR